jgi:hypothetical protein
MFAYETGTVSEDTSDLAIAGGWQSIIRPSAFYTEPSYLGYICLCLYVFVHRPDAIKKNYVIFALLLFICVIAKTASGFIILCLFFFCVNARGIVFNKRLYPLFAILCGVVVYFSQPFISRLLTSTDSVSESSGNIRLIFPAKCVSAVFMHAPFGVPHAELPGFLQASLPEEATVEHFDNGLVNIFINFGVFGFIIWACLISMMRDWALALFVVLCSLNNGTVFGYDKAVIISISILAYSQNRWTASNMTCRRVVKTDGRTMQHTV